MGRKPAPAPADRKDSERGINKISKQKKHRPDREEAERESDNDLAEPSSACAVNLTSIAWRDLPMRTFIAADTAAGVVAGTALAQPTPPVPGSQPGTKAPGAELPKKDGTGS